MLQLCQTTRSLAVAPGDTTARRFAAAPARWVLFQAPASNAGTVTLLGVDGSALDPAGPALAAGGTLLLPVGTVRDLSQLGYRLSNAADALTLLYGA